MHLAGALTVIAWSFTFVSISAIAIRVFLGLRRFSKRYLIDDVLISITAILLLCQAIALTLFLGRGKDTAILSERPISDSITNRHDQEFLLKLGLTEGLAWIMGLWMLKGCILLWMVRLIRPSDAVERLLLLALASILIVTLISSITVTSMECGSITVTMHPDPTMICWNSKASPALIGGTNILNNILLVAVFTILPITKSYLHGKAVGAYHLLLALGILTTICSLMRMIFSIQHSSLIAIMCLAYGEVLLSCLLAIAPYSCKTLKKELDGSFRVIAHTGCEEALRRKHSSQCAEGPCSLTTQNGAHTTWNSSSPVTLVGLKPPPSYKKAQNSNSKIYESNTSNSMTPPTSASPTPITYSSQSLIQPIRPIPLRSLPTLAPVPPASPSRRQSQSPYDFTSRRSSTLNPASRRQSVASRISSRLRKSPAIKIFRTTEVRITVQPKELVENPYRLNSPPFGYQREANTSTTVIGSEDVNTDKKRRLQLHARMK